VLFVAFVANLFVDMAEDSQQLKERLIKLSDEELIDIVQAEPGDYRQEAIDIAKAELKWRKVEIPEPEEEDVETGVDPASTDPVAYPLRARSVVPAAVCIICGGAMRQGTLVAEKELTIVFADNQEERFVKVSACTRCGQVSLVVDYETDVQQ
jgi:hypothetical protein